MKWIRRLALTALVAAIGLVWFARPSFARYGNPCKSNKDCDSLHVCRIWSDGSKTCEDPPPVPGNDPPPGSVIPTPRACHSTKECDSGMKCLTTGSQDPTTGGCVGGAVGTPGVCSPPWCLP